MIQQPYLRGVGQDFLDIFEIHWQNAWRNYPPLREACLLTICSHAKPYSKSYIHSTIRKELYMSGDLDKLDYVHISNAGIVPSAAENDYPFCAYDWDDRLCTDADRLAHIKMTARRLREWYGLYGDFYTKGIYVYLRHNGHTIKGVKAAAAILGDVFKIVPTSIYGNPGFLAADQDNSLTHKYNIKNLVEALNK
jgi:hypothetical protein